jgi:hypothetical protein
LVRGLTRGVKHIGDGRVEGVRLLPLVNLNLSVSIACFVEYPRVWSVHNHVNAWHAGRNEAQARRHPSVETQRCPPTERGRCRLRLLVQEGVVNALLWRGPHNLNLCCATDPYAKAAAPWGSASGIRWHPHPL